LAGIPRIGGFSRPTLQKIISLEPDLIIATSDVQADTVAVSLKAGLPVLALNPHRLHITGGND
jgi:iron complex transport system substrate-binding protein